jgi:hypothetical protein
MLSKAKELYIEHHTEFEQWFISVYPNFEVTFHWEHVDDGGWYNEHLVLGAWIAWLDLTGKNTCARSTDTIDSLSEEIQRLNESRLALSTRTDKLLIPLADQLIDDKKIHELKTLVSTFPACGTRMKLAGKIAYAEDSN